MPTPLPTIAGAYYGTIEGEFNGLPTGNVYGFQSTNTTGDGPSNDARALTIATSLANQFGTHMMTLLHSNYAGSTARVYPLGFPTRPAQEFHAINSGAGGGAIGSPVTCALVKHVVSRRGRGSQSRSYLNPVPLGDFDAGERTLTDAYVAAMNTGFNAFIDGVLTDFNGIYTSETLTFVQVSRVGAGATHPITSSATEKATAYQRRRARRRAIA